jgi:1-deoxy-D-xylulose-5-phosphate reductoisomerase
LIVRLKKASILGASGSVGRKAFKEVVANGFEIIAISGNKNYSELIKQAEEASPHYVCVSDNEAFNIVKSAVGSHIKVLPGCELNRLAALDVDICFMSIAGAFAVEPTFACLGHAKRLAISSKEAIIIGGHSLREQAQIRHTEIIPIDSEHNAIFQSLIGEDIKSIRKIIITASGGPFIDLEEEELEQVAISEALCHPNWRMGATITIDSATMFNKAKEIIEAAYLFDIYIDNIEPLIHPDSIIHGIVEFVDGTYKAVLTHADMKYPILNAIHYPKRIQNKDDPINFVEIGNLKFKKPKQWQKRNIDLAYLAFHEGKVIEFIEANDLAVKKFLNKEIRFNEIYKLVSNIFLDL